MRKSGLFSCSSLVLSAFLAGVPTYATAQTQAPSDEAAGESTLGSEIVVSARRKDEILQDVPQSLNVVTSETITKLNVTQFADLQNIVAGLSLKQDGSGTSTTASLRGITFEANTKAEPTVAMYLNDVSVQSLFLFSSFYDVGQVEVLKGPQGTTRGVASPSGAITVTTHKPNLSEAGGYVSLIGTNRSAANVQAAVNLPIVTDVLGVRFAGTYDRTDANGVKSIHNPTKPSQDTFGGRASLLYQPSDDFKLTVVYQFLKKYLHAYDQVSGPGLGTAINPAISPDQLLSVQDGISNVITRQHFVTLQADARIFDQNLTYIGSYQASKIYSNQDSDQGNLLPGVVIPNIVPSGKHKMTHELRLASYPSADRFFDYVVGFYYDRAQAFGHIENAGPLLPGAFGSPANGVPASGSNIATFDPRYQVPIRIDFPYSLEETSVFGNLTFHLGPKTELSGGIRHIWSNFTDEATIATQNGLIALPPAFIGGGLPNCAVASLPVTYPGFCDITILGGIQSSRVSTYKNQPTIYNVSLSHKFSDSFMVYANTGSSYRPPVSAIGLRGALTTSTNPAVASLVVHPMETSTSYEIGFKSTFLEGRAYLNVSAYYQKFKNLTIYVPNVLYRDTATPADSLSSFTASVDARVKGIDVDVGFRPSRNFNISAQFTYARGKVNGSLIPCNISGPGGVPVYNTEGVISLCPGNAIARTPDWSATIQSEYQHPVTDRITGFIRGLLNYTPTNPNAEPNFTVPGYALVNLYLGLRADDGAWEVSAFARNLFNARRAVDISPVAYNLNGSLGQSFSSMIPAAGSGYYATSNTPRREFGLSLRYAWGSR